MIKVEGLVKYYGKVKAVDGVSFEIKSGEIFGLLGPNGAGKTTIVKILTTLTKPDAGRCFINGFDVIKKAYEIKKFIGVVPQENNLDRDLTVYENMFIYGKLHKISQLKEKIKDLLENVGLWERKDALVSKLSGGMQRRLLLARALLSDPQVLFLDEPSIGLDPQIRRHLWEIIKRIKKQNKTVFLTTHYIEEAEALCDRVGILSKGRLIALGTPSALKQSVGLFTVEYTDKEGRLKLWTFKTKEEAYEFAKKNELPLVIRETNLEDVFIKLTGERIE
ncbi:MAG: Sulfate-transporting ATPase [Thermodesulfobacterium sp. 37_54]|uniref:ABC transporter n=2 Tax=Thermodesulfobacterium commune TaxID=1741 RepID=A0A075WS47_9BACT|nr:ATP-binding cassette domain-containing protein [Thermodesulfobacterium commune]KUJ97198.1 MAG: Sulfate-transporting ATPase [Thermodesulfobacterium sp. 37_54]AIH04084.1 ABC transporter [Thermodesulfobacterium commune DSM 2178]KUK37649.1 MAG: Sulfate-transporting ATPase [Thermodesulfobacterium commune]HAA84149.1 ABC transporter [Thermodesulfobacterium commune]HCE79789.1 ABC transporter [Thermodesulfobacterium commune]